MDKDLHMMDPNRMFMKKDVINEGTVPVYTFNQTTKTCQQSGYSQFTVYSQPGNINLTNSHQQENTYNENLPVDTLQDLSGPPLDEFLQNISNTNHQDISNTQDIKMDINQCNIISESLFLQSRFDASNEEGLGFTIPKVSLRTPTKLKPDPFGSYQDYFGSSLQEEMEHGRIMNQLFAIDSVDADLDKMPGLTPDKNSVFLFSDDSTNNEVTQPKWGIDSVSSCMDFSKDQEMLETSTPNPFTDPEASKFILAKSGKQVNVPANVPINYSLFDARTPRFSPQGFLTPPEDMNDEDFPEMETEISDFYYNKFSLSSVYMSPFSDCEELNFPSVPPDSIYTIKEETQSPSSCSGAVPKLSLNTIKPAVKRKIEEPEISEIERKRGVFSSYNRQANPKRRRTFKEESPVKKEIGPFSEHWDGEDDVEVLHIEHNYSLQTDSSGFQKPLPKKYKTQRIPLTFNSSKLDDLAGPSDEPSMSPPKSKTKRPVLKQNSNNFQSKHKPKVPKKNVRSEEIRSDHNAKERERRKILAQNYVTLHSTVGLEEVKCSKNKSLDLCAAFIMIIEHLNNHYLNTICKYKKSISSRKSLIEKSGVTPKLTSFTGTETYKRIKETRATPTNSLSNHKMQVIIKCLEQQQGPHFRQYVRQQCGLEVEDIIQLAAEPRSSKKNSILRAM